jgi:hypothetical protein
VVVAAAKGGSLGFGSRDVTRGRKVGRKKKIPKLTDKRDTARNYQMAEKRKLVLSNSYNRCKTDDIYPAIERSIRNLRFDPWTRELLICLRTTGLGLGFLIA